MICKYNNKTSYNKSTFVKMNPPLPAFSPAASIYEYCNEFSEAAESLEIITMVMFSGGVVGKFGEENVKPLSVPAS